ncbi:hypothetical protein [Microbulbifer sp. ZKSA002]|uniref:hypothetical protein n=1 Tax=Microbulbifer sp. ZKSA002 TaxID=3243388 RepID=UPI00403A0FC1
MTQKKTLGLPLTNSKANKVIGRNKAVVDGKVTALAGCNNTNCQKDCLRKDSGLIYRETWQSEKCPVFIPAMNY